MSDEIIDKAIWETVQTLLRQFEENEKTANSEEAEHTQEKPTEDSSTPLERAETVR